MHGRRRHATTSGLAGRRDKAPCQPRACRPPTRLDLSSLLLIRRPERNRSTGGSIRKPNGPRQLRASVLSAGSAREAVVRRRRPLPRPIPRRGAARPHMPRSRDASAARREVKLQCTCRQKAPAFLAVPALASYVRYAPACCALSSFTVTVMKSISRGLAAHQTKLLGPHPT